MGRSVFTINNIVLLVVSVRRRRRRRCCCCRLIVDTFPAHQHTVIPSYRDLIIARP